MGAFIWLLAALFFLYEFFLRTFLGSLSEQIMHDLSLNAEQFSLLATAYYITYAIMQVPVGFITDRFGVKWVLFVAAGIAAAGMLLFASATDFYTAFIYRIMMGFGSSFAFVCLLVIVYEWFPPAVFALIIGASQLIGTMGPTLAGRPLVWLMELEGSWRETVLYIGIAGIVLSFLILLFVKNREGSVKDETRELTIPKPTKEKLIQLGTNRQAWLIACFSALIYTALAVFGAEWGTRYLQTRGFTQSDASLTVSILWLGYAFGCPALGAISDAWKRRSAILSLGSFLGLLAILAIVFMPVAWHALFYVGYFALGIATASSSVAFATIAEKVPSNIRASALGLNNCLIMMAGGLMSPVIGALIDYSAGPSAQYYISQDFFSSMVLLMFFMVGAFVISFFFIRETFAKPQKEWIVIGKQSKNSGPPAAH